MIKKYKWILIIVNTILIFGLFIQSVFKKETTLEHGQTILFELAPVDPRSLMQGDYMTLRYQVSEQFNISYNDSIPVRGYLIFKVNKDNVATGIRLQPTSKHLGKEELAIQYFISNYDLNIGSGSYFFQEGEAEKYNNAKYGAVKLDDKGNSILIGLCDEHLKLIK